MTSLRMCLQDKEAREPKKNAICQKINLASKNAFWSSDQIEG